MGRFARTLGALVLLGSFGSCGSLTYDLWDHGGDKHWNLEEYRFGAEVAGGEVGSAHSALVLSCRDEALTVAWKRLAHEHARDAGTHLDVRGGSEGVFLVTVLNALPEGEIGCRITVAHHRDESGSASTHAVLSAHGTLSTYETLRPLVGAPEEVADPALELRCPLVARCLAVPGFQPWRDALGARGSSLRWIGLRGEAASEPDTSEAIEGALGRSDVRVLRRFWLRVAWSREGTEHRAEVRADTLAFARSATTALGNGYVSWDASATFTPKLTSGAQTSRPDARRQESPRGAGPRVQVALQRKSLVRRAGLSTPVRILLTPVTLAADIATLGIAVKIAEWFEEKLGICVSFEWDPESHRFVPVIG